MAVSSRGVRAASVSLRGSPSSRLWSQCAQGNQLLRLAVRIPRRLHSASVVDGSPNTQPLSPGVAPPDLDDILEDAKTITTITSGQAPLKPTHRIRAGVILMRAPLLMRELTPFENAFYLYQKRLNERLVAPFRPQVYFKHDTPPETDWRMKLKERRGVAGRDIGRYNPRGRDAWNDELLVGSPLSKRERVVETLLADAVMRVSEDGEIIPKEELPKPQKLPSRKTEADERGDVRRLDRALDRTLYLVVKKGGEREGGKATWGFPDAQVLTDGTVHETAKRALAESVGVDMNTWIIGRHPVAFYKTPYTLLDGSEANKTEPAFKSFFLKGRIMAGQANLAGNKFGLTDFKWLTREELQEQLPRDYYSSVKGMFDLR